MNDDDARRMWDESADAYNAFVEGGHDYYRTEFHGPALLEACGDVRGLRVIDVGCGQGWFSRELVKAGLVIRRMREPRPSAAALAKRPEIGDANRLPYFLVFELRAAARDGERV